jgi:hypothetical protein
VARACSPAAFARSRAIRARHRPLSQTTSQYRRLPSAPRRAPLVKCRANIQVDRAASTSNAHIPAPSASTVPAQKTAAPKPNIRPKASCDLASVGLAAGPQTARSAAERTRNSSHEVASSERGGPPACCRHVLSC